MGRRTIGQVSLGETRISLPAISDSFSGPGAVHADQVYGISSDTLVQLPSVVCSVARLGCVLEDDLCLSLVCTGVAVMRQDCN